MNISRLQLLSQDIAATAAFYRNIPGLSLIHQDDSSVHFLAGTTDLVFLHTDLERPVYHFAFTIPSNRLEEARQDMDRKTKLLELPGGGKIADFSHWNANAFYFYDNNGNIVEYIARYDLGNDSDRPFSGESICCISEAGLVSDDVPGLADRLQKAYAIPVFSKQPPQDNFTVLGDNNGLLILVATERAWYPTDIKARHFPVQISFRDEKGHEIQLSYDPQVPF